ncbi:Regulator of G-protein signaling 7 like protein [Argiope bruennichi]|uniref:Regulator of G-protein signaling 7 like protein n=1 Tax=Argiope bruennichi TaxID=94029 RepID=A0A8T0EMX6_ARGBR|nr:Regulator of G-protein signaling 7 like protein [Argiope bruennichi]
MQNKTRLELADYEAENLARLQKMFSRKWEFIFMQAEAQAKVDKKRDKLERKVLDSQERAFWDVHRPVPGCVNTTEMDIKKACRMNKPIKSAKVSVYPASGVIKHLKNRLERRVIKVSKAAESYINFFEQYQEYDAFLVTPEPSNPWISDSVDFWELEKQTKDIPARRVRRWAFSLKELLKDPAGREQFFKFLEKEFSAENLKFWDAVQELKQVHSRDIPVKVQEIWDLYLAPEAGEAVNIDSRSYETTKKNMEKPDRWAFEEAAAHLYQLMKSDSYTRYLRSEMYKEYLNGMKKKTSVKGIRSVISFSAKKDQSASSS